MNKRYTFFLGILLILLSACNLPALFQTDNGDETAGQPAAEEELEGGEPFSLTASLPPVETCPGSLPALVTDLQVYQPPEMPEPEVRQPFLDPVFGTCLVRITDRRSDPTGEDRSAGMKNEYSRVQSFNADGSLMIVRSIESYWYVYDVASLQRLGRIPLEVEPRWGAENPHLVYHIDGARLLAYDLESATQALVHDFSEDFPGTKLGAVWTRYEGSPSADTRYWGLMAEDEQWETIALLVYDFAENRVISKRLLPDKPSLDSVTISPLGNFFLAYHDDYCAAGELGSAAHPCGLMVYDRSLENPRGLLRIIGHSDTALDADGREVLIYQDIDTDNISMLDLQSGEITPLAPIDYTYSSIGLHFSGRAFERPGWAVVSIYNGSHPQSRTWMDDVVFAIELKPNPRIIRLAHTHSRFSEAIEKDYWAEPQASVNPDFTRLVFTSNWGRSGTEEVEMWMIMLPQDWTELLP